jgi:hypothetical protein
MIEYRYDVTCHFTSTGRMNEYRYVNIVTAVGPAGNLLGIRSIDDGRESIHDVLRLILDEGGSVARTCVEEAWLYAKKNKNGRLGVQFPLPKTYLQLRYLRFNFDTVDSKGGTRK